MSEQDVKVVVTIRETIKRAFPASPAYRALQPEALAVCAPEPESTEIRKELIEHANFVEDAMSGKIDLAVLYHYAASWGDTVDFKARKGKTARQILQTKDYAGSFYYYYTRAYEK